MRRLVEAGLFLIGAGCGFLGEALMESSAFLYAIIAFCLGGFLIVAAFILWISKKKWPGRSDWYATSSYPILITENDPQRAIEKDRRKQWRSAKPQELDAWFEVDMARERTIESISFETDDSSVEKPGEWRIMFYGKGRRILGHKDGKGFIFVEGNDIPNPIQYFRVQIKEIAEDMPEGTNYAKRYGTKVFLAISLIRVREYRFNIFGRRFLTHEV
jgi:hypothetical protein